MKKYEYTKLNDINSTYKINKNEKYKNKFSYDDSESDIWAEKYRPRIVEDLILPKNIKKQIRSMIKNQQWLNLTFFSVTGGSGKDSIISVLKNSIPTEMLCINASAERGIDVIKDKCFTFATGNALSGDKKVIYLTEASGMTNIAMDGLKKFIEDYSSTINFVITTNSLNNIPQALQTRLPVIDMNEIPNEERSELAKQTFFRLKSILEFENIDYKDNDLKILLSRYFPSFRELMMQLQLSCITGELIIENDTNENVLNEMLQYINNGDLHEFAKQSSKINVLSFATYMRINYLGMLETPEMISGLIPALNTLQQAITSRVPFLNISLCVFGADCIRNKIKFKI